MSMVVLFLEWFWVKNIRTLIIIPRAKFNNEHDLLKLLTILRLDVNFFLLIIRLTSNFIHTFRADSGGH